MLDTGDLRKTELIFRGSRIGTIIYFHIGWQRPFPIILKARRLLCICAKIWLGINQKRDCIFIKKTVSVNLQLHNRCARHISTECNLGLNRVHILPPGVLTSQQIIINYAFLLAC